MKKFAPALPAKDHEGIGANLMLTIIKSIEIINSWQVGMQLAALWLWGVHHVR